MPSIVLYAYPAERTRLGGIAISIGLAENNEVVPRETVNIETTDDAVRALDAFAAKVAATGKPARVRLRLAAGARAPRGFRIRERQPGGFERLVNL